MLEDNNAYEFFSRLGDLVITGPTLTNVNDYRVVLLA
jgi:hydroxypyruvate reductase